MNIYPTLAIIDSIGILFIGAIIGALFFLGLLIWLILKVTKKPEQQKIKKTIHTSYDMPDLDSLIDETENMESVEATASHIEEKDDDIVDVDVTAEELLEVASTSPETKASNASSKIDIPVSPVETKPESRSNLAYIKLNTGHIARGEELITIFRDSRDQRLIVQINDTAYRTLVDSPDRKKEFLKIMKELSVVVMEQDENPPLEKESNNIPQIIGTKSPSPIEAPIAEDDIMPGKLPSYSLDDNVVATTGGRYKVSPVPEFNLAKAIEEYLQHKLKYIPEYSNHTFHIHSASGGGVRIQVNNDFYEAVGDVKDEKIRAFLIDTIQEWYDKQ